MITSRPLAPNMLPYPEPYPDIPAGGPLGVVHDHAFLTQVAQDPAALGYEGSQEDIDRLRVAAVYVHEEDKAEHLRLHIENRTADTTYQDNLKAETTAWLESHCDTRHFIRSLGNVAHRDGRQFYPIITAQTWASHDMRNARTKTALLEILTEYERQLYRPVIRRLQERAAAIPAESAARELRGNITFTEPMLTSLPGEQHKQASLTALRSAQRAFRRAGTMEMSIDELQRRLGTPEGFTTGMVVHILARLGAVRRSTDGRTLHATEVLNVPQGKVAGMLSAIGERVLHLTHIRRVPEWSAT